MDSIDDRVGEARGAEVALLRHRVRVAASLVIASNLTFAAADLFFQDDRLSLRLALKGAQLLAAGILLRLLPRLPTARAVTVTTLTALVVVIGATSISGIFDTNFVTAPILVAVICFCSGTLVPWGIAPHGVTCAVATVFLVGVAAFRPAESPDAAYSTIAGLVGVMGSIVVSGMAISARERLAAENQARQQILEALRENESRFRGAFDYAPIGMALVDLSGHWLKVNHRLCAIVGYSAEELLQRTFQSITHPDDLDEDLAYVRRLLAGEIPSYEMEKRYIHKSGRIVWILLAGSLVRDTRGNPLYFVAQIEDISQRRLAEEELDRFFSLSLEMLCIANFDGYFVRVNPAMAANLGYSERELTSRPFVEFIHPEDLEATDREVDSLRQGAVTLNFVNRYRRRDGTYRWFEWTARPSNGLLHAVARDVTDRRKAAAEIVTARDEAISASAMKSSFLANLSHEIRTPLNAILGLTEVLLRGRLDGEEQRLAETIQTSGVSLLNIINDVLDLARIEAGRVDLEEVEFDLPLIVEEVAELFASQAHKKGVGIAARVHADVPRIVRGDPARLRQVLSNLVGNAVKFTTEGTVLLELKTAPSATDGAPRLLQFEVRDTGIGIPADVQRRIFEPFCQADSTTTRRYGGSGLGLTICRELVENMGGAIGVESELGRGSRFWFTLSLPIVSDVGAAPRPLHGYRILVVDGDPVLREALVGTLEDLGAGATGLADPTEMGTLLRQVDPREPPFTAVVVSAAAYGSFRGVMDRPLPTLLLRRLGDEISAVGIEAGTNVTMPVRASELCRAILRAVGRERERELPPPARESAAATGPGPRGRVLVVEDNVVNQHVACSMLSKLHYRVEAVQDGAAALALLAADPGWDAVLMDWQMPAMDGFETTRRIRALEKETRNHVTIIAMTANVSARARRACLEAGMDDYLSKPVTIDRLEAVLHRWIDAPPAATPSLGGAAPSEGIDVDAILTRFDGDRELFVDVAGLLLADLPDLIGAVRSSAALHDGVALERAAHALRGAIGNFGPGEAHAAATKVEQLCRTGRLADAGKACDELERATAAFEAALREQIAKWDGTAGRGGGNSLPALVT